MANVLSIAGVDKNSVRIYEREKTIAYGVALSGNYATHTRGANVGEVIIPNNATGSYVQDQLWGQKGPSRGYVLNSGGTGYSMSIVPGADALHWLFCVFSGVATELAAGAYPAGLLADLDIVVEFTGRAFD